MSQILIIDDENDIREIISDILKDEGYNSTCASSASESIQYFEKGNIPSLVILDIWLEGSDMDGIGILKYIKSHHPSIPVIMISGHGNIETAIQTIKLGAYDFIEKPFKTEKLLILVNRAIEASRLAEENKNLKLADLSFSELLGKSKIIQQLKASAMAVAEYNSRVIINGEDGSGKESLARMIHKNSKRVTKVFNTLQISHISSEELEINIFGSNKNGSKQTGILEKSHQGTLFINEVANMPLTIQNKFLSFLNNQSFEQIGSNKSIQVDVRIIAASSKDLEMQVKQGTFNQSLYHRLNVVSLQVPSIIERKEDIPLICQHFLKHFAKSMSIPEKIINHEAMTILNSYDWPGNIRQLGNAIEWIYIMTPTCISISPDLLPIEIINAINQKHENLNPLNNNLLSKELKTARELFEKEYLIAQLDRFDKNISKTASFIGMDRTALHRKIKSLGIKIAHNDEVNFLKDVIN